MTGIFITARLGSTRLSDKHLVTVAGKTLIEWLALRMLAGFKNELDAQSVKIFITTSVKPENKEFEKVFAQLPVNIFYGSDENIPFRHLQCAIEHNIDHVVSIDGDDILCSVEAARKVMEGLNNGTVIVKTEGLPLGMNVMGYQTEFLKQSLENHAEEKKLETGWGRIFSANKPLIVSFNEYPEQNQLRFTLDYHEDASFFTTIIAGLKNEIITIADTDLIQYVLMNEIFKLNSFLNDSYWDNFNNQIKNETT